MKILVVSDNSKDLKHVIETLEQHHHEILCIKDTSEIAASCLEAHIDTILIGNIDTKYCQPKDIKAVRDQHHNSAWMPIIALIHEDQLAAITDDCGFDDLIIKPISQTLLTTKIQSLENFSQIQKTLIETQRKLEELSTTDMLTHIPNRTQFHQSLGISIANAKRYKRQFSLLFVDLDNFKLVNDNAGHHIGDLLLKAVAHRLRAHLRSTDFIARIGGDEFAIILNDIKLPEDAGQIATKLINSLKPTYKLDNQEIHTGCSIGIATYPVAGEDPETLAKNADIAMYKAKQSGRNGFQYFTEQFNTRHARTLAIESLLQFAIEKNEFELYYQPQFDLVNEKLIGAETLLRWHNNKLQNISPAEFIPIAEKTGLIVPIGKWIIERACQQVATWVHGGYHDLVFSVNLSPVQLEEANFSQFLKQAIQNAKLSTSSIQLELTETAIMSYSALAENTLHELNKAGIEIAIDDFGTGYSSLSHLKRLPISALKIDRSFVKNVLDNQNDTMIIKSVIALAHNLNLSVIAEGIETKEQQQFLIKNGCDYGQGYYLSKPLNQAAMTDFLKTHANPQGQ